VDLKKYVDDAARTSATADAKGCIDCLVRLNENPQLMSLLHGAMGISTEAGELLDVIKKHIFYGKPVDQVNLAEEVGDTMWYVAEVVRALRVDLDSVLSKNIDKLRCRYPDKFSSEAAVNRNLDAERKILER
jgi:NTP pyrophosphatase (non-canonical NTP hydrolase)